MITHLIDNIGWGLLAAIVVLWVYVRIRVLRDREEAKVATPIEEAIDLLRARTERSVPKALVSFAFAVVFFIVGMLGQLEHPGVITWEQVMFYAAAIIEIMAGVKRLVLSPQDKFLLLLADRITNQPNQALPTTTSVTAPAGQEPPQP